MAAVKSCENTQYLVSTGKQCEGARVVATHRVAMVTRCTRLQFLGSTSFSGTLPPRPTHEFNIKYKI